MNNHLPEIVLSTYQNEQGTVRQSMATFEGHSIRDTKHSPIPLICRHMIETLGMDPETLVSIRRQDRSFPSFKPSKIGYWAKHTIHDNDDTGLSTVTFRQMPDNLHTDFKGKASVRTAKTQGNLKAA